ncbi:MAG TPA: hypothetical protein VH414_13190 [Lichenihabitans sp.]|nr:hypothetical protein [Lichenihabitans sp.]
MNHPARAYLVDLSAAPRFEALTIVRLRRTVITDEGVEVPQGTKGTIVAVWAAGEAYEVEFAAPHQGLATVDVEHLEATQDRG